MAVGHLFAVSIANVREGIRARARRAALHVTYEKGREGALLRDGRRASTLRETDAAILPLFLEHLHSPQHSTSELGLLGSARLVVLSRGRRAARHLGTFLRVVIPPPSLYPA